MKLQQLMETIRVLEKRVKRMERKQMNEMDGGTKSVEAFDAVEKYVVLCDDDSGIHIEEGDVDGNFYYDQYEDFQLTSRKEAVARFKELFDGGMYKLGEVKAQFKVLVQKAKQYGAGDHWFAVYDGEVGAYIGFIVQK